MSYETFMEARANQGCELDWDAEQCTCENNGETCDYCWQFCEQDTEIRGAKPYASAVLGFVLLTAGFVLLVLAAIGF